MKSDDDFVRLYQLRRGLKVDGVVGDLTLADLDLLCPPPPIVKPLPNAGGWHTVTGTSFADPADIRRFRSCKDHGGDDQMCFKVGDNGIGKWGDDTTGDNPMCALPYEMWEHLTHPSGTVVEVRLPNGSIIEAQLRDTMPHLAHITNGAGIDMNPALCEALGLKPPVETTVQWRWKV